MKFYWAPRTRAARIAWMLEETGLDYERIAIDIHDEAARGDAEFRSASPMGKVPALIDGETRLWDSGAICLHLADAYPETGLGVPASAPGRGAFVQWLCYTNSVIEPAMAERFLGLDANTRQYGFGSFDLMIETLANGIGEGPWILGETFSAADVLLGSSVHSMHQFGLLPEHDVLIPYMERCTARPAFERAYGFDDEVA